MSTADEVRRKQLKPPSQSSDAIQALVLGLFNVAVGQVTELDSYDDRNYLVETSADNVRLVLKIHNGVESENSSFVQAQMAALQWLASGGLAVPLDASPARRHGPFLVRLLSYLPGDLLVQHATPTSLELYVRLGKFFSRVDARLLDFDHPAAHRSHVWDLKNFAAIRPFVSSIADGRRRQLVLDALAQFEAEVLPNQRSLRTCVLQSDMNDRNVVVMPDGNLGLIDFGDMVHSWLVNELAIALAYTIIPNMSHDGGSGELDDRAWLRPCAALFTGYMSGLALTQSEVELLYALTKARVATSCTLGAYSASLDPTNAYLLIHAVPAFRALEALHRVGRQGFLRALREDASALCM
jgi:hydroxylysine kinase